MPLLPARLQINDPAFRLGEKVQPKKAEPAPCPSERPVSRLSAKGAKELDRVITARLSSNLTPQSSNPPALSSKPVADPDGWIPHDGGPCPVDGKAAIVVRGKNGRSKSFDSASEVGPAWVFVTAYKLTTPPEAPKGQNTDPNGPGTPTWRLKIQQQRQREGRPVEWDKVPVGSKVWVRDEDFEGWRMAEWRALAEHASIAQYPYCAENKECGLWTQCKLHIEGVEP